MRERLWPEATALVALAERYHHIAALEQARVTGTTETLPLSSLMDVRFASDERVAARFHIDTRPGVRDPDRELKESFQDFMAMRARIDAMPDPHALALEAHVERLETDMRAAGLTPPEMEAG